MRERLMEIGAGLLAVEAGPEIVKGVFNELSGASGAKLEFLPGELPDGLKHFAQTGVEAAQAIALPLAALLVAYEGLKYMVSGADRKKS